MKAPWLPLGEVLELQRRRVVIDPQRNYVEVGLRSFGRGVFHKDPLPGLSLGDKRVFNICAGDLLVSNVFGWEGAVAVAEDSEAGLVGSHRFMTWTPKAASIDVAYVAHFLLSDDGMVELRRASPGSAGRNRTLSIKNFEAIRVPLPGIEDQRLVVLRLTAAAEPAGIVATWASARQRIDALRDRLVIDAGGVERTLGEVVKPVDRRVPIKPQGTYPMARIHSFARGMTPGEDRNGDSVSYSHFRQIKAGDFVYQKLMAWEGGFAVVPHEVDGRFVSTESCVFEIDERQLSSGFFSHLLAWEPFWRSLAEQAVGTNVRRRRLYPEQLLASSLTLPPMADQRRIASHMASAAKFLELARRRDVLIDALLPAARNEVFSQLR